MAWGLPLGGYLDYSSSPCEFKTAWNVVQTRYPDSGELTGRLSFCHRAALGLFPLGFGQPEGLSPGEEDALHPPARNKVDDSRKGDDEDDDLPQPPSRRGDWSGAVPRPLASRHHDDQGRGEGAAPRAASERSFSAALMTPAQRRQSVAETQHDRGSDPASASAWPGGGGASVASWGVSSGEYGPIPTGRDLTVSEGMMLPVTVRSGRTRRRSPLTMPPRLVYALDVLAVPSESEPAPGSAPGPGAFSARSVMGPARGVTFGSSYLQRGGLAAHEGQLEGRWLEL